MSSTAENSVCSCSAGEAGARSDSSNGVCFEETSLFLPDALVEKLQETKKNSSYYNGFCTSQNSTSHAQVKP
jgi:hypothetical protein